MTVQELKQDTIRRQLKEELRYRFKVYTPHIEMFVEALIQKGITTFNNKQRTCVLDKSKRCNLCHKCDIDVMNPTRSDY